MYHESLQAQNMGNSFHIQVEIGFLLLGQARSMFHDKRVEHVCSLGARRKYDMIDSIACSLFGV